MWISGQLDGERGASGFYSAAFDVDEVSRIASEIEGGGMVAPFVANTVQQQADIFPDDEGVCKGLSLTIIFRATRSFYFTDPPEPRE